MSETRSVGRGGRRGFGKWHRMRQVTQVVVLLLFLLLLLETRNENDPAVPADLFFHLDPLVAVSAMLASRTWMLPMALSVLTLLLSVAVGRAWCGWVCPLGTLLDWTPSRRVKPKKLHVPAYWRQGKNLILFIILIASVLGSLSLIVLDPITILVRTFASVIIPLTNSAVTAVEEWLYQVPSLRPGLEWLDSLMRSTLLTYQPFYLPSLLIALLFAVVLALNAIRPRFWCRYLCPLGALLGLVSRIGLVRHRVDDAKCIKCLRCATGCPTNAINPERNFVADSSECITCLDCVEICPTKAISFGSRGALPVVQPYGPSRRQFLVALGAAALGAALLRTASAVRQVKASLIRPPGSTEEQLLSKCIRCGECVRVCPTGVIQPSAADPDGLWTPAMQTRLGYCDYSCNACGQACPTGAITQLALEDKRRAVIGKAVIDEKRCIPFAEGRDCIVCEEMCPIPEKAIVLEDKTVVDSAGVLTTVRQPRVTRNLCTGCGICEYQCPVNGESAIRINLHSEGEAGGGGGGGQGRGGGRGKS